MRSDPAKIFVLRALRHLARTTMEIAVLHPSPFSVHASPSSTRNYSELLRHAAWIPKEEVLLWNGFSRSQIEFRLGGPITSAAEFQSAVDEANAFFENEIGQVDLQELRRNKAGYELTVYEWCLEAIAHYAHHRAQIYAVVLSRGAVIPESLTARLFLGHLPRSQR